MIQRRTSLKRTPLVRKPPKPKPSFAELLASGKVVKASSLKPRQAPIRKRAKKKPGQQTQIELFKEIWNERPHVSEVSGEDLIPMPDDWRDRDAVRAWVSQFSHLLNKGHYSKYKSDKRNIKLKTIQEHALWEEYLPSAVMSMARERELPHHLGWMEICFCYFDLKNEANGV
jgi:hypothetical protein